MLVTCPSCASKYEFSNALQAPGDVKITCRNCGHKWIELEAADVIDVRPFRREGIRSDDIDDLPDEEIDRLIRAGREARQVFDDRKVAQRKSMIGWAGYAAFSAVPFLVAVSIPETVVATAPATYKAYQTVGYEVNIYGLEIRRVAQDHKIVKGQRVLTVKGDVVNVTNEIQQIPSMRFALRNAEGSEVYHWVLDTASRPLRPGEVTGFVTRVQEPPAGAKDLQIRFAKEADFVTATTSPIQ